MLQSLYLGPFWGPDDNPFAWSGARIPHFHLMHRAMHPWRTTTVPNIGKFLYRQVDTALIYY